MICARSDARARRKKENIWKTIAVSLLFPILYTVILFSIDNGYSLIWKMTYVGATHGEVKVPFASDELLLWLVASMLFFLITFFIFRARKQSLRKRISWNPPPQKSIYGFAVLLVLGLLYAPYLMSVVIPKSWFANDTTLALVGQDVNMVLVVMGIINPITQETVFRGLMMGHLRDRVAPWLAVALPVLALCVFYFRNPFGQILAVIPFVVSVGLVFFWTRSIRVTMLIQVMYNVIAVLFRAPAGTNTSGSSNPTENIPSGLLMAQTVVVGLIGLTVAVFALHMIYRRSKINVSDHLSR